MKNYKFKIDWVLPKDIAISRAPRSIEDLKIIRGNGIKSIVCLCSADEAKSPTEIEEMFVFKRIILPDHTYSRNPEISEIHAAIDIIEELGKLRPTLIHCVAAMERSPLICMSWLILKHKLSPHQALHYMMQAHPGTNPLPKQLKLLNQL